VFRSFLPPFLPFLFFLNIGQAAVGRFPFPPPFPRFLLFPLSVLCFPLNEDSPLRRGKTIGSQHEILFSRVLPIITQGSRLVSLNCEHLFSVLSFVILLIQLTNFIPLPSISFPLETVEADEVNLLAYKYWCLCDAVKVFFPQLFFLRLVRKVTQRFKLRRRVTCW